MDCDRIWDWMSLYADGEADEAQAQAVETHLGTCRQCAQDMVFLQDASRVLRATPAVEPPAGLRESILLATIDRPTMIERFREAIQRGLRVAPMRYGLVAASGAAAALAFFALTNNPPVTTNPDAGAKSPSTSQSMEVAGKPMGPELGQSNTTNDTSGSVVLGPTNQPGPIEPASDVITPKPSGHGAVGIEPRLQMAAAKSLVNAGNKKPAGPTIAPIPVFQPEVRQKVLTTMGENLPPPDVEPIDPSPMEVKTTPDPMPMKDPMKPEVKKSYTIMLASSTAVVPTRLSDIAKLTGSKNDLAGKFPLPDSLREKNIRLDVVKGSF